MLFDAYVEIFPTKRKSYLYCNGLPAICQLLFGKKENKGAGWRVKGKIYKKRFTKALDKKGVLWYNSTVAERSTPRRI